MLRCIAVHCSALQCVAVRRMTPGAWDQMWRACDPATHCNTLQHTDLRRNGLRRACNTTTQSNTLKQNIRCQWQRACDTLINYDTLQHARPRCNTLDHAATRCNTLQDNDPRHHELQHACDTWAHCNTLQHK